jgi:hypothetical protein
MCEGYTQFTNLLGVRKKNPGDVNTSKRANYLTFTPCLTCLCTVNEELSSTVVLIL